MTIPKKLRQQCWENVCGKVYSHKCYVSWCTTDIDVWTFEVGHNVAEANGGTLDLSNLFPICSLCNKSMGTTSIDEWSKMNSGDNKKKCYTGASTCWCGSKSGGFSCFSRN
jgi:hypothetical protein